jgi:hypothetical protein
LAADEDGGEDTMWIALEVIAMVIVVMVFAVIFAKIFVDSDKKP